MPLGTQIPSQTGARRSALFALIATSLGLAQCSNSNDSSPANSILASPVRVAEGTGTVTVNLVRNSLRRIPVTVTYTTVSATALEGLDFSKREGTVTWGANDSSSRAITIPLNDDGWIEGTEQFALRITNVTGGVFDGGDIPITIEDDDSAASTAFDSNQRLLTLGAGNATAIGDVDGDMLADIALGQETANGGAGRVVVMDGRGGSEIFSVMGSQPFEGLGSAIAGIGDVNGDGTPDIAAFGGGGPLGVVRVLSGVDGAQLYSFNTTDNRAVATITPLGDVDGDGRPDFAIGVPADLPGNPAYAMIRSGANGLVYRELFAQDADEAFGSAMARAGDLDGDGVDDLIVGAPRANAPARTGAVYLFSSRTGQRIARIDGVTQDGRFGAAVTSAGDVNADQRDDIAIGAPGQADGAAYIYSGLDRSQLQRYLGQSAQGAFGSSLAATDWDGDNSPDLIVGDPAARQVLAFSGTTNTMILQFDGSEPGFGKGLTLLDDTNGDGAMDLLVASDTGNELLSAKRLSLAADVVTISLKAPGVQRFSVNAGPRYAGLNYIFGGSLGDSPGFDLGGVQIPLNDDYWLNVFLRYRNTPLFMNFQGKLDAEGKAMASINTPIINDTRGLENIRLFVAYLVYENDGTPRFASNAVPSRFIK